MRKCARKWVESTRRKCEWVELARKWACRWVESMRKWVRKWVESVRK